MSFYMRLVLMFSIRRCAAVRSGLNINAIDVVRSKPAINFTQFQLNTLKVDFNGH